MYGALMGDFFGSPFEFNNATKQKDFQLISSRSLNTGYAGAAITCVRAMACGYHPPEMTNESAYKTLLRQTYYQFIKRNPNTAYSSATVAWVEDADNAQDDTIIRGKNKMMDDDCVPVFAVIPVAWLCGSEEETRRFAKVTANAYTVNKTTIKNAEAVAMAIFMLKSVKDKDAVAQYIYDTYGIERVSCSDIRSDFRFDESSKVNVSAAFAAFMDSHSIEDAIRNAISLGGCSSAVAGIAGALAEAYYGLAGKDFRRAFIIKGNNSPKVFNRYDELRGLDHKDMIEAMVSGNDEIEKRADEATANPNQITMGNVLNEFNDAKWDNCLIIPARRKSAENTLSDETTDPSQNIFYDVHSWTIEAVPDQRSGCVAVPAYTSKEHFYNSLQGKHPGTVPLLIPIAGVMTIVERIQDMAGLLLNPWAPSGSLLFPREVISVMMNSPDNIDVMEVLMEQDEEQNDGPCW